jgi:hypothetical protein
MSSPFPPQGLPYFIAVPQPSSSSAWTRRLVRTLLVLSLFLTIYLIISLSFYRQGESRPAAGLHQLLRL